ncbi:MAG TPA: hypothetical protein VJK30_01560 [Coxiellaceae bacterium]|nr:MAG: hypothetical protein A3E81_04385 [Gammaproteobacteria bacterium RIFCSPHIGHO2_12_FULL_36_30]HLB56005.1 hypothetical protein [Coxiellaceae bacterium]
MPNTISDFVKKIKDLNPTQKAYFFALVTGAVTTSTIAIAGLAHDDSTHSLAKDSVKLVALWIAKSGAGSLAAIFLVTASATNTLLFQPFLWAKRKYEHWHASDDVEAPNKYASISDAINRATRYN